MTVRLSLEWDDNVTVSRDLTNTFFSFFLLFATGFITPVNKDYQYRNERLYDVGLRKCGMRLELIRYERINSSSVYHTLLSPLSKK